MPRGNGTGPPWGKGPGAGRGAGKGRSQRGRMGGSRLGAGSSEECICPQCGAVVPHEAGIPCSFKVCSKCGSKMMRK